MYINIGGVRFTTNVRQPCDTTGFVNRAYRSYDFGRTIKFTTTTRIRYDDVSE